MKANILCLKKIMLIFGTHPEAIKMEPLTKAIKKVKHVFQPIVCVTGQHREILDQVLQIFEIVPGYIGYDRTPGSNRCWYSQIDQC